MSNAFNLGSRRRPIPEAAPDKPAIPSQSLPPDEVGSALRRGAEGLLTGGLRRRLLVAPHDAAAAGVVG